MAKAETYLPPLIPLGDRVLIELILEETSAGGLVLPTKECKSGIIRHIGAGVPETMVGIKNEGRRGMVLGDRVFLPRGDKIGDVFTKDGKTYVLLPVQYISAILN